MGKCQNKWGLCHSDKCEQTNIHIRITIVTNICLVHQDIPAMPYESRCNQNSMG